MMLLTLYAAPALASALFAGSEQAPPNGTVCVRGEGIGSGRFTVWPHKSTGARGAPATLTPLGVDGNVAYLRLPNAGRTVYEIAHGGSNSLWVNRPRIGWIDQTDPLPGTTLRLVGRNFSPFGGPPTVTLTGASGRRIVAKILRATDSCVEVRTPVAPPGTYAVSLNNGLAGAASADASSMKIRLRPAYADPFGLDVGWAADAAPWSARSYDAKADARLPAHPAGDGKREDGAAIAADLHWIAQHGGGTLRLGAGAYRIDKGDDWVILYPNTVLRGAGRGKTTLQLGYVPTTVDYHCPLTFLGYAAGVRAPEGIMDLTIQNLNASGAKNRVLNAYNGAPADVFLKRVEIVMGNAHVIDLSGLSRVAIEDCHFDAKSMTEGTLHLGNVSDVLYLRNVDTHRAGRLFMLYGTRIVMVGNRVEFDNAYRNQGTVETGGVDLSFTQDVLLLDNDLGARGPMPDRNPGDGEVVLTQVAESRDLFYLGSVARTVGRTVTFSAPLPTTQWQDPGQPSPVGRMGLFIVGGRGEGQWRRPLTWTATSVVVDRPWQTPPDATSRFALAPFVAYGHTYVGNRVYGGFSGLEFEHGAVDSAVQDNTLTDTGSIFLLSYAMQAGYGMAGSNGGFMASWNDAILGNRLANTTGKRPAAIVVACIGLGGTIPGPLVLGTDVRGNSIVGKETTISAEAGQTDGIDISAYLFNRPARAGVETMLRGTVVQDNAIRGSAKPITIRGDLKGMVHNAPS